VFPFSGSCKGTGDAKLRCFLPLYLLLFQADGRVLEFPTEGGVEIHYGELPRKVSKPIEMSGLGPLW
jgi:hypothetical protein